MSAGTTAAYLVKRYGKAIAGAVSAGLTTAVGVSADGNFTLNDLFIVVGAVLAASGIVAITPPNAPPRAAAAHHRADDGGVAAVRGVVAVVAALLVLALCAAVAAPHSHATPSRTSTSDTAMFAYPAQVKQARATVHYRAVAIRCTGTVNAYGYAGRAGAERAALRLAVYAARHPHAIYQVRIESSPAGPGGPYATLTFKGCPPLSGPVG